MHPARAGISRFPGTVGAGKARGAHDPSTILHVASTPALPANLSRPHPHVTWGLAHLRLTSARGRASEASHGLHKRCSSDVWSYVDRHAARHCCRGWSGGTGRRGPSGESRSHQLRDTGSDGSCWRPGLHTRESRRYVTQCRVTMN